MAPRKSRPIVHGARNSVMLIDGSTSALQLHAAHLRCGEFSVVTVHGPEEGLRQLRCSTATLVLVSDMPGWTAAELVMEYREWEVHCSLAGFACTDSSVLHLAAHPLPALSLPELHPPVLCLVALPAHSLLALPLLTHLLPVHFHPLVRTAVSLQRLFILSCAQRDTAVSLRIRQPCLSVTV